MNVNRKGKDAERDFVAWMRAHGFPSIERRLSGDDGDTGDTTGHPGMVCEVKNRKAIELAAWCDQLTDEMVNAGVDIGAVFAKRRGKRDVGEWYAILPAKTLVLLLRRAGYGDPEGS